MSGGKRHQHLRYEKSRTYSSVILSHNYCTDRTDLSGTRRPNISNFFALLHDQWPTSELLGDYNFFVIFFSLMISGLLAIRGNAAQGTNVYTRYIGLGQFAVARRSKAPAQIFQYKQRNAADRRHNDNFPHKVQRQQKADVCKHKQANNGVCPALRQSDIVCGRPPSNYTLHCTAQH